MRELAVQAQNGTLETADKTALGVEFDALESEIDRIASSTSWGGKSILDGSFSTGTLFNIEVGLLLTSRILLKTRICCVRDWISHTVAQASTIAVMDAAHRFRGRAGLGAISNRLDSTG